MSTPVVPGYELVRRLGRGGMGEVWLARRPAVRGVAKSVAIKLVRLDPEDPRSLQSFVDEAQVSTLLGHSNIAQVFDVGTTESFGFLVSEVVDGADLARLVAGLAGRGETPSLPVVAYVIGQVLRGLAYAHTLALEGRPLHIVHRDISPQNVLISVSGEVKLIDFGIARFALRDTTGVGIKGKLRYMSPEQFGGKPVDARTDLYAVGAMLHELLSGDRFRKGQSVGELYGELGTPTIPELPSVADPVLDELRRGLLQPEPERRIATAADAIALLSTSPSYRDAAAELADECRRVTGVTGPRAGLRDPAPDGSPATSGALTGPATWGGDTTAPGLASGSDTFGPVSSPSGLASTVAELGPPSAPPRVSSLRPHALRIAVAVAVLILGTAMVGAAVALLVAPKESISPGGPEITAPRHRDTRWHSGFCLMRRADGSDVVVGFATVDGAKRLLTLDAATGDVVGDEPADDAASYNCLTRRVLEIRGTDGTARRIDADGVPATAEAEGRCVPRANAVPSVHDCPDAMNRALDVPLVWDRITQYDYRVVRVVDGSWVRLDFGSRRLVLQRVVSRNDSPPGGPPRAAVQWSREMSEIGPATHATLWVRGAPVSVAGVTATHDVVAVYTSSSTAEETAVTFLDLDDGSRVGRIVLDRRAAMVTRLDAPESIVVLALAGPGGLIALDPADSTVLWRVIGVELPWE